MRNQGVSVGILLLRIATNRLMWAGATDVRPIRRDLLPGVRSGGRDDRERGKRQVVDRRDTHALGKSRSAIGSIGRMASTDNSGLSRRSRSPPARSNPRRSESTLNKPIQGDRRNAEVGHRAFVCERRSATVGASRDRRHRFGASPGGAYFGCLTGHNASSNPVIRRQLYADDELHRVNAQCRHGYFCRRCEVSERPKERRRP